MHPKDLIAGIPTNMCIPMFTAALLIISKRWEESKCPPTDK
jgi:hypothetical protein